MQRVSIELDTPVVTCYIAFNAIAFYVTFSGASR